MNEDFTMIPIASSSAYTFLLKYIRNNENLKEIKVFIVIQSQDNENDNYLDINLNKNDLKSQQNTEDVYSNQENSSEFNEVAGEKQPRKLISRRENRFRTKRKQLKRTLGGVNADIVQCY